MAVEGAVDDHQRHVAARRSAAAARRRGRRRRSTSRPGRARRCERCGRGDGRGTTGRRRVRDGRPRAGRRRRSSPSPARSAGRCRTRAPADPRDIWQKKECGCDLVRPPGWPSNWLRLWPPCRWTVSSPASCGQPVLEGDLGALSRRAPDRRPREGAVVGPHPASSGREGSGPRPRGIGISIRRSRIRRGIGRRASERDRARPGACGGRAAERERANRPPSRDGSRTASAPPPRAPRKARRPRRGGDESGLDVGR